MSEPKSDTLAALYEHMSKYDREREEDRAMSRRENERREALHRMQEEQHAKYLREAEDTLVHRRALEEAWRAQNEMQERAATALERIADSLAALAARDPNGRDR